MLSKAVGTNVRVPSNAPDQPDHNLKGFKLCLLELIGSDSTTMKEVKTFFDLTQEGVILWQRKILNIQKYDEGQRQISGRNQKYCWY